MKQEQITRHNNRKTTRRRNREPQSVSAVLKAEKALDVWFEKWRVVES